MDYTSNQIITRLSKAHLFFLAICVCLLPQFAVARAVVNLGFNYPQTGPYALNGQDQYRGALLAVDEINAKGGILGHQIRLITRDSGSNVRKTRGNINSLLMEDKVKMVFGGVSSEVAIAACELCQAHWVPFFGTLTYSTATTGEAAHRACFRETYNSWMAAKLIAAYMQKHYGDQRYFYITVDYTWGWTTEQSLRKLTGTQDVNIHPGIHTPLGTTNFIKQLQKVKTVAPDVLVLSLAGMDLVTALRQATVMGLKEQMRIIVPNITLSNANAVGPKAMAEVIGAMPWYWKIPYQYSYPRGIAFVEAYNQRYNDQASSSAASAYTILYQYKAAVERAGSFDGPAVIQALEGHAYQMVKDQQTWREFDHQSIQTVYLVRGRQALKDGDHPIKKDLVEIIDSLSGVQAARTYAEWSAVRRAAGKAPALEKLPEH